MRANPSPQLGWIGLTAVAACSSPAVSPQIDSAPPVGEMCPELVSPTCPGGALALPYDRFATSRTGHCGGSGTLTSNVSPTAGFTTTAAESDCDFTLQSVCGGGVPAGATASCEWDPFPASAVIVNLVSLDGSLRTFVGTYVTSPDAPNLLVGPADSCASPPCFEACAQSACAPIPAGHSWVRFRVGATEDAIDASADGSTWTTIVSGATAVPNGFLVSTQCYSGNSPASRATAALRGAVFSCP